MHKLWQVASNWFVFLFHINLDLLNHAAKYNDKNVRCKIIF